MNVTVISKKASATGFEWMKQELEQFGKPISKEELIACRARLAIAGYILDKKGFI